MNSWIWPSVWALNLFSRFSVRYFTALLFAPPCAVTDSSLLFLLRIGRTLGACAWDHNTLGRRFLLCILLRFARDTSPHSDGVNSLEIYDTGSADGVFRSSISFYLVSILFFIILELACFLTAALVSSWSMSLWGERGRGRFCYPHFAVTMAYLGFFFCFYLHLESSFELFHNDTWWAFGTDGGMKDGVFDYFPRIVAIC